MTLSEALRGKRVMGRKRGRVVRPMGAWEIYEPDPEIRREESKLIHWAISNRRRHGKT